MRKRMRGAGLSILSETRGILTGLAVLGVAMLVAISVDLGLPGQELLSTLRFHIAVAMLVLPLALLLTGARLRALVLFGLIALSLTQGVVMVVAQQERRAGLEMRQPRSSFEALSFNVLNSNQQGVAAARYIAESTADVVVLMEGSGVESGWTAIAESYPYRLGCEEGRYCDLAILSRTPFVDAEKHLLHALSRWRLFQASTMIEGQLVTVVALHLTKPYFDNMAEFELRQAKALIASIPGPVLVMGDFNAAAWSNDIDAFADGLNLVPPPVYPATWPVELGVLGAPIDNMFTRGDALIRHIASTPESFGSNHLGLYATVELF
jgi:endonuclease/exonuclease/phosphatase (EEP) superfamily protein YafD